MSGLNPISRTMLRLANSLAGPRHGEWTAAMAAETDAADGRGTLWAVGALFSAIGLHWRDHPWRSLFVLFSPLVMFVLIFFAMWPLAILQRTQDVPAPAFFAPIIAVQIFVAYTIGRTAPGAFPLAGLGYFLVTMIVVPAFLFYILVPASPGIVTGERASFLGFAPIYGIVISVVAICFSAWLGYAKRTARVAR